MCKTSAPSKVTARDPKGLKFMSVVQAAYDKAGLVEEEAQRVNDTPGLPDVITNFIAKNRSVNKYKDEEVRTNYTYPSEYKGPKPIKEQIKAIAEIFGLDPASALEYIKNLPELKSFVPDDAFPWVGWFAIPSVDAMASIFFPEVKNPSEKYCRVVQLVHKKIAESRSFTNWRDGQIDTAYLQVSTRTLEAMDKIAETQKGDILIIAAQLGKCHAGRSVRRAREVFVANEYGLTSVAVGSIVLVHPKRLTRYDELDMDCAGDEFSDGGDSSFGHAPCFSFYDAEVKFDTHDVSYALDCSGSASAFVPQ